MHIHVRMVVPDWSILLDMNGAIVLFPRAPLQLGHTHMAIQKVSTILSLLLTTAGPVLLIESPIFQSLPPILKLVP